jgi:hypothetical protein
LPGQSGERRNGGGAPAPCHRQERSDPGTERATAVAPIPPGCATTLVDEIKCRPPTHSRHAPRQPDGLVWLELAGSGKAALGAHRR